MDKLNKVANTAFDRHRQQLIASEYRKARDSSDPKANERAKMVQELNSTPMKLVDRKLDNIKYSLDGKPNFDENIRALDKMVPTTKDAKIDPIQANRNITRERVNTLRDRAGRTDITKKYVQKVVDPGYYDTENNVTNMLNSNIHGKRITDVESNYKVNTKTNINSRTPGENDIDLLDKNNKSYFKGVSIIEQRKKDFDPTKKSLIQDNDAMWVTKHPQIASGYANTGGAVFKFKNNLDVTRGGSPIDHPHLAVDTRKMSIGEIQNTKAYDARNVDDYERVLNVNKNTLKNNLEDVYTVGKGHRNIYDKSTGDVGYYKPMYEVNSPKLRSKYENMLLRDEKLLDQSKAVAATPPRPQPTKTQTILPKKGILGGAMNKLRDLIGKKAFEEVYLEKSAELAPMLIDSAVDASSELVESGVGSKILKKFVPYIDDTYMLVVRKTKGARQVADAHEDNEDRRLNDIADKSFISKK